MLKYYYCIFERLDFKLMCDFYKWHVKIQENECEVVEFSNVSVVFFHIQVNCGTRHIWGHKFTVKVLFIY